MERYLTRYTWFFGLAVTAFLVALVGDLAAAVTSNPAWKGLATGAIVAGLVLGVIAGIPGVVYFRKAVPRTDTAMSKMATAHMVLDVALMVMFAVDLALRTLLARDAWAQWLAVYLTVVGNLEAWASTALAVELLQHRKDSMSTRLRITIVEHPTRFIDRLFGGRR